MSKSEANDPRMHKLLESCLASGDPGRWLEKHADQRATIAPYLELEQTLRDTRGDELSESARHRALEGMLTALGAPQTGFWESFSLPLLRVGGVATALLLFVAATVGAGAYFSGSNPVEEALSALPGIGNEEANDDGVSEGVADEDTTNASGNAHGVNDAANENASEGSGNADDGASNASGNAHGANPNANQNAAEGSSNSGAGIGNASQNADNGRAHANANANGGNGKPNQ